MISSDTHRQIRGRFSMERREGLVLKGIDEPVAAFLVVNERPHGFQLDRSGGVEGVETTTVGREIELRFLQERMWDVVEEGHWRVVTVVGDAGVGKSRLLLEFDSWLAESPQPVYWFRGRASHDRPEPRERAAARRGRQPVRDRGERHRRDRPRQARGRLRRRLGGDRRRPGDARAAPGWWGPGSTSTSAT